MNNINRNIPFYNPNLSVNPLPSSTSASDSREIVSSIAEEALAQSGQKTTKRKLSDTFDPREAKKAKHHHEPEESPELPDEIKTLIVRHQALGDIASLSSINKGWNEYIKKYPDLLLYAYCYKQLKMVSPQKFDIQWPTEKGHLLEGISSRLSDNFPLIALKLIEEIPDITQEGVRALLPHATLPTQHFPDQTFALLPQVAKQDLAKALQIAEEQYLTILSSKGGDLFKRLVAFGNALPKELTAVTEQVALSLKELVQEQANGHYPPDLIADYATLIAQSDSEEVERVANDFLNDYADVNYTPRLVVQSYCRIASLLPDRLWLLMEFLIHSTLFGRATTIENQRDIYSFLLTFLANKNAEKTLASAYQWSSNATTLRELIDHPLYTTDAKYALLLALILQQGPAAQEAKEALYCKLASHWKESQEHSLNDFLKAARTLAAHHPIDAEALLAIAANEVISQKEAVLNNSKKEAVLNNSKKEALNNNSLSSDEEESFDYDSSSSGSSSIPIVADYASAEEKWHLHLSHFLQQACHLSCQYFPEHAEKWRNLLKEHFNLLESFDAFLLSSYCEPAAKIAQYHPALLDPILKDFENSTEEWDNIARKYVSYREMAKALAHYSPDIAMKYLNSAIQLRKNKQELSPPLTDEYHILFQLRPEEAIQWVREQVQGVQEGGAFNVEKKVALLMNYAQVFSEKPAHFQQFQLRPSINFRLATVEKHE